MKKLLSGLLALAISLLLMPVALAESLDPADVGAPHAILMDADSGEILFEKDADAQAYPASTTKIMTCILALEKGDLDAVVSIPSVTSKGSCIKIKKGEKMSLRSLLYGMMLPSGNDCSEAIAVHIGGTKADFVAMMNAKASELGMTGTQFHEPSGLQNEEHYSTARDLAVLTRYAMTASPKKEDFRAIVNTKTYTIKDSSEVTYELENTNKLIHTTEKNKQDGKPSFEYSGAIGVKTGSTPAAGECLVAAAKRNDVTLIAVLLEEEEKHADRRFTSAAKMFDYGFANITTMTALELGVPETAEVVVKNSSFDDANAGMLTVKAELSGKTITRIQSDLDAMRNNSQAITLSVSTDGELSAPVLEGAVVGTITYQYEGSTLFTADAIATRTVNAMGGGVVNTPDARLLETDLRQKNPASPWLFWILVLVVIAVAVIVIRTILLRRNRLRRRRTRSRRSGGYIYRK